MSAKKILTSILVASAIIGAHQIKAEAQTLGGNSYAKVAGLGNAPYLHLRSNATTNSSILMDIPSGANVRVISYVGNDWSKVEYKGVVGFVDSNYLNGEGSETSNSNTTNNSSTNSYNTYTNYNTSISEYASLQSKEWQNYSEQNFAYNINPNNAYTKYEFLRVNRYRPINVHGLNQVLENDGVLKGQAQVINDAASEYNIDPIYFAAQAVLETGRGTSTLSQGVTIDSIANTNEPIYQNGQLVGYQMIKLPQPVTVFNLFGIGAKDNLKGFNNRALILGTTYAYLHGWTSVPKAIYGAANFLSSVYVNNPNFNQNTPFKLRYIPNSADMWHEYASKPYYANSLGSLISEYSYLYDSDDTFTFDLPVFN